MSVTLGAGWRLFLTRGKNLKTGWLVTAGIVVPYVVAIRPYEGVRGISNSKATGLAEQRGEPIGLWRQARFAPLARASRDRSPDADKVVMEPNRVRTMAMLSSPESPAASPQDADTNRRIVRTSSIDFVVQKPAEASEKIRKLAESLGGFLVTSQVSGGPDAASGSLTVRVPAVRFEEARAEIRKLGLRVESERMEAQDVTRQYVDQAANLRNLRAEAEARVFGLNWRPLYQMKLAFRDGLDGLADYASTMTAIVFYLPTLLLWLATIVVGGAVAWRILRWAGRRAFGAKITPTAPQV